MANAGIPRAAVARLPSYLRYLDGVPPGRPTVSSDDIAGGTGLTAAQVRKDLSYIGASGTRGVGYAVAGLRTLIMRRLGLTSDLSVALIGVGHLGSALANYPGFAARGFRLEGLYDVSPDAIGRRIGETVIRPLDRLEDDARSETFDIGVIATPADAAQSVADRLVAIGVRSILNFAPTVLRVPPGVQVRQVDLAVELQILAFYLRTD